MNFGFDNYFHESLLIFSLMNTILLFAQCCKVEFKLIDDDKQVDVKNIFSVIVQIKWVCEFIHWFIWQPNIYKASTIPQKH